MATNKDNVPKKTDIQPLPIGIVFDLEEIAFQKRRMIYEALSHVLGKKKIKMTTQLYSRYCLTHSLDQGIEMLLNKFDNKKVSKEELTTEVNKQVKQSLAKSSLSIEPVLGAILKEAQAQNIIVGAWSVLPKESALSIMDRLKLNDFVKLHVVETQSKHFPTPGYWLRLAKMLELHSSSCLAFTTCAASCRSALAAGMRCVVIPDEFTLFQNFSGADIVVEGSEKLSLKKILPLMHVCSFR